MRSIVSVLRSAMEGAERRTVTASEGWFFLATVLLLVLPTVLLTLLYRSGLPTLPFEVLLFGFGFAVAGFYWRLCEKRGRYR